MKLTELKKIYDIGFDLSDFTELQHSFNKEQNFSYEDIQKFLHNFTEQESIYRDYYNLKINKIQQRAFLESLEPSVLLKYGLQFPEYGLMIAAGNYPENLSFTAQHLYDVMFTKHPRYSPIIHHSHDFFELVYVLEGKLEHTVSNYTFTMKRGDLCVISPNTTHALSVFSDHTIAINLLIRRSTFTDIFFNLLRGNNVLSFFFLSNIQGKSISNFILFHTEGDEQFKQMFLTMFQEFSNKHKYFSEVLNSMLITLFAHLLRSYGENYELFPCVEKQNVQLYEIISYIQDNYRTATLSELAEHFHFSIEYTSRLVKKIAGKNFTELVLQIRMEKAALLLETTTITLSKLCEELGYLNPEHLIRTFKKYYGKTPIEYRLEKHTIDAVSN